MDGKPHQEPNCLRRGVLVVGFVVTMVASLSVHAAMIQYLHVPYPYTLPHMGRPVLPGFVALSCAAVAIYALVRPRLASLRSAARILVLFLLVAGLNEELFRDVFMDMLNAKPVTIYPIVQWLPKLVPFAALAAIVAWSSAMMPTTLRRVFGGLLIGSLVFVIKIATDGVFAHLLASIAYLDSPNRFDPPYDYHILIPAYLSFAEPVAASFAVGLLAWDRLSRHVPLRIAQLAALILLATGPVFKPFINILYARTDVAMAMLSVGQFLFESIALGVLTGLFLALSLQRQALAG